MTVTHLGNGVLRGLAADTKPTTYPAGSRFLETDTGIEYYYNGSTWLPVSGGLPSPASYLVYIAGSNKKRLNLATHAVEDTNTDATVVIQGAVDACGNTSGKKILVNAGFYSNTGAINFTSVDGYLTIEGEGPLGITQIRPSTDTSAFTITGSKTRINLRNLYLSHNQSGYTSNLVEFKNGAVLNFLDNCALYDFGTKKGNAVGFISTSASVYSNFVRDCLIDGFDNVIFGNVTNSSFFANGNYCMGGKFQNFKRVLTATTSSSCAYDNNNFYNIDMQCYSGTLVGFDYSTSHSGHSFFTTHSNINLVDLPGGTNYLTGAGTTEISLIGCYPAWKIGGTIATNGKIRVWDNYTVNRGLSTQSGNGSTKVFNIAHNLAAAPSRANVDAGHADAIGPFVVTKDSTNIIVTYGMAPASGTSNVVLNWEASVF